jgi:hypothetical protein
MTTNPTPGPWTQGSNYEVVAMDGTNICKVHNDEGQGAANARLHQQGTRDVGRAVTIS